MTLPTTRERVAAHSLRTPILWGLAFGVIQATAPLAFWWLDASTIYAISIAFIATVYIGFAVADGRPQVLAAEAAVATGFVVLAAAAVTATPWLLVIGFAGHGSKDWWQERNQFVANTRWWPPFCAAIDFLAAAILAVLIVTGVHFH